MQLRWVRENVELEMNNKKFHNLCSRKEVYRIKSAMGKRTKVMTVTFAHGGREFANGRR
jgi:hypothetical protein